MQSLWAVFSHLRKDPLARQADEQPPPARSVGWAYFTGLLMTLLNPMTLLFWFTVVPATAGTGSASPARLLPVLCAGVFLATIAWVTAFSGVLALAGRFRRNWWLALADGLGGVMLLLFAAAGFWRLGHPPL
jgi:threonine/homoserine/homoserine lactone efflux protein